MFSVERRVRAATGGEEEGTLRGPGRFLVAVAAVMAVVWTGGSASALAAQPTVGGESVGGLSTTGVTLHATVTPNGSSTTYHFDYGAAPCSTSPCTPVPVPDAAAGAGATAIPIAVRVGGLLSDTTYYYRAVATNVDGTTVGPDNSLSTYRPPFPDESCANDALRRGLSSALPDCRAYEQVTPTDKLGASIGEFEENTQSSLSGNALSFLTGTGIPGSPGAQELVTFLATRAGEKWSSEGVLPPQNCPSCAHVIGWDEGLSQFFEERRAVEPPPPIALLTRDTATGKFQNITGEAKGAPFSFVGTSADGSNVYFEAGQPLTPEASGPFNLYMWNKSTGTVSLVSILPDGTAPETGSVGGPYDWVDASRFVGGVSLGRGGYLVQHLHTLSADGSRAFFTTLESAQLYLRENPGSRDATTIQLSASHKTNGSGVEGSDPHGPQPAAFMGATPDGSVALFTSPEELTNDATTGSEDQGNDLYMSKAGTRELIDLTTDTADANGAEVQGVLGMGDDGSYVYFVANGVLTAGASSGTCNGSVTSGIATAGTCNLYVWHNGTILFIAKLRADQTNHSDRLDWLPFPAGNGFSSFQAKETSRVSGDGRVLLFSSTEPLTRYNTEGCSAEYPIESPAHCRQFYRLDAELGELTCVSCDPTGAAATGDANLIEEPNTAVGGTVAPAALLSRNLSDNGNRVFFETTDPLVAEDVNSLTNVYEWESTGEGSCRSTADNNGCLFLLTPGDTATASYFVDASANGSDAFILTDRALVGQDKDALGDIYDARVQGGLAGQWPVATQPCVGGDECREGASSGLAPTPIATVEFAGAGNFATSVARGAEVRLGHHVRHGHTLVVAIKVPAAGLVTARGKRVKPVARVAKSAGTVMLVFSFTKWAQRALRVKRRLVVRLQVGFKPVDEAPQTANLLLVVK